MIIQHMKTIAPGIAKLDYLGVIRAQGPDCLPFLNSQLTQDFATLAPSQARLTAFCTAKGRMLASFVGIAVGPDEVLLVCSRDLLAATLKRLAMFVLRAKVRLSDASDAFAPHGLIGEPAIQALGAAASVPWSAATCDGATVVALYPAQGEARALWVGSTSQTPPVGTPIDQSLWLWSEVQSGVATVSAAVSEAFVPQMLNYESIGGVSFKKGCYPGQEVVARSQFRGTIKRRAYLVHVDAALQAGQEIFAADDLSQPCGLVVQAASAPTGGYGAIVSVQTSAAGGPGLRASALPDAAALSVQPLPYSLVADF